MSPLDHTEWIRLKGLAAQASVRANDDGSRSDAQLWQRNSISFSGMTGIGSRPPAKISEIYLQAARHPRWLNRALYSKSFSSIFDFYSRGSCFLNISLLFSPRLDGLSDPDENVTCRILLQFWRPTTCISIYRQDPGLVD